jgi:mannose/cellobiose epimerase-like protein (N-acyl-D-glucosamine 2-epimerase family)
MRRLAAALRRRLRGRHVPLPPGQADDDLHTRVLATGPLLERILFQNLVPFWYPRVLDLEHGGYHLNHGPDGLPLGPARKALVANARTLWFFSRMARAGHQPDRMLEAARHGYDFLVTSFLDDRHGGFYWHVSEDGSVPLDATKHQYGQAFAIFALAEYALASGTNAPASFAEETCELVERHLRDEARGGYWDQLERNWEPGALEPSRTRGGGKYLGSMHHLMEAYTSQVRARPRSIAAQRLPELLLICASSVVRQRAGALTDAHRPDWSPILDEDNARVSYGHDIETIHLLISACEATGTAPHVLAELYRALLQYSVTYGQDRRKGGFHYMGPLGKRADRREKIWWVQAEALLGAIEMYRVTRERQPAETYLTTLEWIESGQVDWKHGEWHAFVPPRGKPYGKKADAWKGPYHSGRAVIHSLEVLEALAAPRDGGRSSA